MTNLLNRIFVSIGVSQPGGRLDKLPGAISASERMARWADSQDYIPVLINDAIFPEVTVDLLRDEIANAVCEVTSRAELERLVVFFAGHGFALGIGDQYWVLTNWHERWTEAVKVSALQRMLEFYGPKQVSIISDACQEFSEKFIDLVGSPILDRPDEQQRPFELDQFFAVDAGKQAFMIKARGHNEAFCIFTEVLLDALEGDASDEYFEQLNDGSAVITSQSIARYLNDMVEKESGKYGVRMVPRPKPGFYSDRVYFTLAKPPFSSNRAPQGPSNRGVTLVGSDSKPGAGRNRDRSVERKVLEAQETMNSNTETEFNSMMASRIMKSQSYKSEISSVPVREHFETGCGICISGAEVAGVIAAHAKVEPVGAENSGWFRLYLETDGKPLNLASTDVLISLKDGRTASVCAVGGFVASVHFFGKYGSNVIHRPIFGEVDAGIDSIELLANAHAGILSEVEIIDAAAELRNLKHEFITLGSVVAQFYDVTRDTESLRSIAAFYAMKSQPVPLDVILFGGGTIYAEGGHLFADIPATLKRIPRSAKERGRDYTFAATDAIQKHSIAGRVPWMRQAWSAISTATYDESARSWRDLAFAALSHIAPGDFTVIRPEGRAAIMALAGIGRPEREPEHMAARN